MNKSLTVTEEKSELLRERIASAVKILGLTSDVEIVVERPALAKGDYTTNVAFLIAKVTNQNPIAVGEKLINELEKNKPDFLETIELVPPGFINFRLKTSYLAEYLGTLITEEKVVTKPRVGSDKKIVIEYSAPNIAKPMGVGHLRSAIIGQALANIYRALDYQVITTNHLGDWGTQFGKLIVAYKRWHNASEYQKNPIQHLLDLYVRFTDEAKIDEALNEEARLTFRKLEQGDKESIGLWEEFRRLSLREFLKLYERLGVSIEHQMGESDYRALVPKVYDLLKQKSLVREEQGALVLDLESFGLGTTLLRKSDEGSLYITRDLAQIMWRVDKWHPDTIIYVVGQDQSLYFKQLFTVAKKAGIAEETQLLHVGFGLVLLEGKRMRTREGKVVFLEEVLDEAHAKAEKIVQQKSRALSEEERQTIAELVGIGGVKYNDLSQNRLSTISFDWQKMLSLEGNSAPYLMYTVARVTSVLEKAGSYPSGSAVGISKDPELTLLRLLDRYTGVVVEAQAKNTPHLIATYLFELAQAFNEFYATQPILKAEPAVRENRLALAVGVGKVIKDGLALLGIQSPERM